MLTLKRAPLRGFTCTKSASKVNEFWILSLQPAEPYYILLVFLCWMENVVYILYI